MGSAIMVNRPVHSPGVSNEEEITWEKSIVETVMHENIAPLDRFDLVVEFVVHNRHTRETSDLLAQQYRKTAMAVSKALTAVFNEKASARKAIVNDTARFPGDEEERLQKLEVRQQEEVEAKQAELERERVRLEKERKDAMKNIQNEEDGKVHKALVDKLRRESAAVEKDLRNVQKDAKSRLKKQLEARRRKKQKELEEKMKSNAVEQEAQITLL